MMLRSSILLQEKGARKANVRPGLEAAVVYGMAACLLLSGCAVLLLPFAAGWSGAVIFTAGWLLLFCVALTLVRAIAFNRGFPDFVMSLFAAVLYAVAGWAVGTLTPGTVDGLEDFRFPLALLLLCAGVARVLAYAGLWERSSVHFPLLPVYGLAETAGAAALLFGFPGSATAYVAVNFGLLLLLGAGASYSEARRIRTKPRPARARQDTVQEPAPKRSTGRAAVPRRRNAAAAEAAFHAEVPLAKAGKSGR